MLQKMMDRMFKKVAGVVYDMTANSIGITKGDSVFTVCQTEGGEYELVENLLASLSAPIPAIARSVPLPIWMVGAGMLAGALGWV